MLWTSCCGRFGVRAIMPLDSPTLSAGSTVPVVVVRPWRPGAVEQRPPQRPWQRHMWRFPSRGLALAALLGAALLQGHTRIDPPAAAWRARLHDASLVAALGATRVVEPRLTGGFAYAPWTAHPIRTVASGVALPSSRLLAATARIETLAQSDARPESLRVLGVAYLLLGRPEQAIDTLERARATAPDDPRTLSDLAAVLLTQSAAPEDTWDALRALNYAERAWRLAPGLPEAAFNAALARERLHLRSEARKAWQAVQRLEPGGAWAAEADRHVTALSVETVAQVWPRTKTALTDRLAIERPLDTGAAADRAYADDLTRRFPQAIREYLQEDLLPAWASAHLAGDSAVAARRLTSTTTLCTALARDGDGTCVRTLARITAAPDAARLAAAHRDFGAAMKLFRKNQYALSEPLFAGARAGFVAAGSPDAFWCDVYLAINDYRLGKHEGSSGRLRADLPHLEPSDLALRGRIGWQLALNGVATEDFVLAIQQYEHARSAFRRAREAENEARMDTHFGYVLTVLANPRDAWEHFDRALARRDQGHNLSSEQSVLANASLAAFDQDLPDAALAFPDEFLANPQARHEPVAFLDASLTRSAALGRLGLYEAARAELVGARRALNDGLDPAMRDRAAAEIDVREGRMLVSIDPTRAIPLLTGALDGLRRKQLNERVPAILQFRGQAYARAGDTAAAERDFLDGVRALEQRASSLTSEPLLAAAREQIGALLGELIQIELTRGAPLRALAYAEQARRFGSRIDSPLSTCDGTGAEAMTRCWLDHLPTGHTGVYYLVLKDRLAIWVLRPSGITHVTHDISADSLRALVYAQRRAMEQPRARGDLDRLSTDLFDHLIRPIAPLLDAETRLLLMPDAALHGVPFSALRNAASGRYLIDDHVILQAPSYSHAVARSPRAPQPFRTLNAVVVMNPRASGVISAALPRLPGTEAEARDMAAALRHVTVLARDDATKSRLRDALADAGVLHIGSHARANHRAPWRSYFVLAPEPGRAGEELLYMRELSTLPLRQLRLAVLAACGSADGPVTEASGGALNLAYPFLSNGVPTVIASLWPIADRSTSVLFSTFYAELARGVAPEDALRHAQLALLHGAVPELRHPTSWAPFVVMGTPSRQSADTRGTT